MSRFNSLKYAPSETRTILRERFARRLGVRNHRWIHGSDTQTMSDELMLCLLRGLTISVGADWERAQAIYGAASRSAVEPEDLEALARDGWIRKLWGRVRTTFGTRSAVRHTSGGSLDGLKALLQRIFDQIYHLNDAVRLDPRLANIVGAVEAGTYFNKVVCQSPGWVAARLWEDRPGNGNDEGNLREWMDKWELLRYRSFIPGDVWSSADAEAFRAAALAVLALEPGLVSWAETRAAYIRDLALTRGMTVEHAASGFPELPKTLVARVLWLNSRSIERSFIESQESCRDILQLVRLLLADVVAEDQAAAPHPMLTKLADLSIDRAELFFALLSQFDAHPVLLADLLLRPETVALACLLVARWQTPVSSFDRVLAERDNTFARNEAFLDAAALLAEFLREGRAPPAEAAALLGWFHATARVGFVDEARDDDMLRTFRRELSDLPREIHLAMIASFSGGGSQHGLGTPEFAALLDLIAIGNVQCDVDPVPIVNAYVESVYAGGYGLTARRIGPKAAASLFQLASRRPNLRRAFLRPPDIGKRLAENAEDNPYILADSLARSVRAHICVLSRAIVGLRREIPEDLIEALTATVRVGAIQHEEKRRVAAFAPRHEQAYGLDSIHPLAADLGAAITALDDAQRLRVLDAILETDEPLLLAQLISHAPSPVRGRVKERIAALAPGDAGSIRSLPEMQARIDALLQAGAADAAAAYIEAECKLTPIGNPPEREAAQLRSRLHLHYLRNEWQDIKNTPAPNLREHSAQLAAEDALSHFKGLAALGQTPPDAEGARDIFQRRFDRQPNFGDTVNWFAARCSMLLPAGGFEILTGDALRTGRITLEEFERMLAAVPSRRFRDEAAECNKAVLLLAVGEPLQALAVVSAVSATRLNDTAAALKAVAQARLGQVTEALATLDAASGDLGNTQIIIAARAHIGSAAKWHPRPSVLVAEDLVRNISEAIARFRVMDPGSQARALKPEADASALVETIMDYVRAASDSVVSLVPMMKGVQIDTIEDDLTAFIQHVLQAYVNILGWTVSDQTRGGFTAKGNAGERDLLLSRGNTTLALLEAVVCERSLDQIAVKRSLESHFQKLFSYGNPSLFFYLTYAYVDDPVMLLPELERIAETTAPSGFPFRGLEQINRTDSRPPGFVAFYDGDYGEVRVVFLVLNLGQKRQRDAGKTANATVSRRSSKPKPNPLGTSR